MEGLPGWVMSPMPGPPPRRTNMKDNTHQSSQQDEYGMMITTAKWYSGTLGGLKFPDICLTGEEKPRKNLTQETCPDRRSDPGPLRDKRACYHLLHSGGPYYNIMDYFIIGYTDNGIISFRAYSLYCYPGSNITLFKYVRYIKKVVIITSSIRPHIYNYQDNNWTKQYVTYHFELKMKYSQRHYLYTKFQLSKSYISGIIWIWKFPHVK